MKQPLCLGSLSSGSGKQHWVPENDPDPAAEVKAGDLYLLTGPPPPPPSPPQQPSSPPPSPSRAGEVRTSGGCKRRGGSSSSSSSSNGNSGGRAGGRVSRYPVRVTVYRSSYGHYAVLTASLRCPATYLNLRTCHCRPCTPSSCPSPTPSSLSPTPTPAPATTTTSTTTFRVELGGGEGQVIYFEVPSTKDRAEEGALEEWVEAFQGVSGGVPPSPGSISPSLSPLIPRSPIMPTLQESLEEEEDDEEEEDQEEEEEGEISGLG